MKKLLHKFWKFFLLLRNYLSGDFAYQNYLQHHLKTNQDQEILSKKLFLRERAKRKWNKINRCC